MVWCAMPAGIAMCNDYDHRDRLIEKATPFGTLLCDPTVILAGLSGAPFAFAIPANCSLAGFALCAQGASTDGISILLTNALDTIVGSY